MKKHKLFATILLALASNFVFAQSSETVRNYINTYKQIAMQEMQRTGVPAAITLAQGIHETSAGTSDLVVKSNNHFGIKCKTEWTGATVYHDDDAKGECFRKYDDPSDSYRDHSDFLKNRPYYASLFNLDPTDYKAWAYGLKKAGYATNPKYAQILIKLIEDYNLEDYTLMAMNGKTEDDVVFASANKVISESSDDAKNEMEVENAVMVESNYPTGVFKINETSVVFVPKGTSFLAVADRNNISLSRLFEFNEMKPVDIAATNQLMFLQRKRKIGASEFHTVTRGETLHDIAQAEGIRMENLLEYNALRSNMQPAVGEKLYLREKAPASPALARESSQVAVNVNQTISGKLSSIPSEENNFIVHIVQPKETVYAISKKYAVDMDDVMKWNDMQSIDLKTGQQIRISKKSANAN